MKLPKPTPAQQAERSLRAGTPPEADGGLTGEAAQALRKLRELDRELAERYEKSRLERRKAPRR